VWSLSYAHRTRRAPVQVGTSNHAHPANQLATCQVLNPTQLLSTVQSWSILPGGLNRSGRAQQPQNSVSPAIMRCPGREALDSVRVLPWYGNALALTSPCGHAAVLQANLTCLLTKVVGRHQSSRSRVCCSSAAQRPCSEPRLIASPGIHTPSPWAPCRTTLTS
jgi:hypothetical protein